MTGKNEIDHHVTEDIKAGLQNNNGQSMDNVQSELGIERTNPWIAVHVVQLFTCSKKF